MGKLNAFLFISLDGYYKGLNGDISWYQHDAEGLEFSMEGLASGNTLLFGRVTYQMMASFWTSPMARQNMKAVADGMNNTPKIVFSRTLENATWNNTRLIHDNLDNEINTLKQRGTGITILGSGTLLTQCADYDLIDHLQLLVAPVAIGDGASLFKGLKNHLKLKLTSTRTFKSGSVLLSYERLN